MSPPSSVLKNMLFKKSIWGRPVVFQRTKRRCILEEITLLADLLVPNFLWEPRSQIQPVCSLSLKSVFRFDTHTIQHTVLYFNIKLKLNFVAWVRERTILSEWPPLVGEVSANSEDLVKYILYPQKLALTSPTSDGRSVGIVRSHTQATEFFFVNHITECNKSNFYLCAVFLSAISFVAKCATNVHRGPRGMVYVYFMTLYETL
jgi:hypothetical protein